jgi:lambda family phage portal protein
MGKFRSARKGRVREAPATAEQTTGETLTVPVNVLPNYTPNIWTGEKFAGGLGPELGWFDVDYWTLRARSARLFRQNLFARGIIRRLVTSEINVGLHLEATPRERLLGLAEEALADWAEDTESRFELWGNDSWLCDAQELRTFGALQRSIRAMALVDGDVLIVLEQSKVTGLPRVRVISGASVQTPLEKPKTGNKICHGVEIDSKGRQVAYWVTQDDGSSKRLPAYGEKSGRKLSWLVYGTDRRHDDVRGEPLLALVAQSLKELDRYRDATIRKAVVNSMLALFVKKTADKPGTRALTTGGAVRRGVTTSEGPDGSPRRFNTAEHVPGLVLDELQVGEEPQAFAQNAATEGYGVFQDAVIASIAWANEIPPEILVLSFNSNYSASKAANNEFEMYVDKVRTAFGDECCKPIYVEWLVASVLKKDVKASGLVESWRDNRRYTEFAAWTDCEWVGALKPSIDLSKVTTAYKDLIEMGLITRDRAARAITGMKYSRVVKQLARENPALAEALKSIVSLEQLKKPALANDNSAEAQDALDAIEDRQIADRRGLRRI